LEPSILIFVRHAHRDTARGRQRDNGLSKKGRRQALAVRNFFQSRFGKNTEAALLSSPKRRCLETLQPLADLLGTEIQVQSDLEERQPKESLPKFGKRVQQVCGTLRKSRERVVVVCSHGDWLPTACEKITGLAIHLNKGGWMEFSTRGRTELTWVCQKL
jgi:broad specificity phosphatase PhoE